MSKQSEHLIIGTTIVSSLLQEEDEEDDVNKSLQRLRTSLQRAELSFVEGILLKYMELFSYSDLALITGITTDKIGSMLRAKGFTRPRDLRVHANTSHRFSFTQRVAKSGLLEDLADLIIQVNDIEIEELPLPEEEDIESLDSLEFTLDPEV